MAAIIITVLLSIIGIQAVVILGLVKLVNKSREEKKAIKRYYRMINKGFIANSVETHSLYTDYKEAYEACYQEYYKTFTELKYSKRMCEDIKEQYKEQYVRLQESYEAICHNVTQAIREGRLIKSRYGTVELPYKFESLTKGEVIQLFGRAAVKYNA